MSQILEKYKFFELFNTLNPKEKRGFYSFALNEKSVRSKEVTEFIEEIDSVQNHLLKGEVPSTVMRRKMNYALNSLNNYLVYAHLNDEVGLKKMILAHVYRNRRTKKNLFSLVSSKRTVLDTEGLFYEHRILEESENFELLTSRTSQDPKENKLLDQFYLVNKLKQACHSMMSRRMTTSNKDRSSDEFLKFVYDGIENNALTNLYYGAYQMLLFEEVKDFRRFKEMLQNSSLEIAQHELRDLYTYAINFCIRKLNTGEAGFSQMILDLYRQSLPNKTLYVDGHLSPFTYKNITTVGLMNKEFRFVKDFLENYKDDLPKSKKESFYAFNKARLAFELKEYDKVPLILREANIKDFLTKLSARVLEIKAFMSLDEYDLVYSLITNLNRLVRRNKDLSYHRDSYIQFGKFVYALIRVNPYDKSALERLRTRIDSKNKVVEKNWLIAELDQYLLNAR